MWPVYEEGLECPHMVGLQEPAHFVPHVVQCRVSQVGGCNDFVIMQPRIILRRRDASVQQHLTSASH